MLYWSITDSIRRMDDLYGLGCTLSVGTYKSLSQWNPGRCYSYVVLLPCDCRCNRLITLKDVDEASKRLMCRFLFCNKRASSTFLEFITELISSAFYDALLFFICVTLCNASVRNQHYVDSNHQHQPLHCLLASSQNR